MEEWNFYETFPLKYSEKEFKKVKLIGMRFVVTSQVKTENSQPIQAYDCLIQKFSNVSWFSSTETQLELTQVLT